MLATDCDDSHPDPISRCGDTFVLLKIPFDFLPEKKRVYSTFIAFGRYHSTYNNAYITW